jgi:MoaA/NifB/PqqE/SkfB family radical SAM enzyme
MDMNVYRKLLSDLKEFTTLNTIAFWGIGEPLAHPEIVNMVALANKMSLKTEIITNGHLLDKNMTKGFIQAGLDTLVVSVDGATPASYEDIRLGGNLQQVEGNIRELNMLRAKMARKNPEIGLEFVVMKSNIDQLPGLADKARSMEAGFIIVTNLLPCTEDMKEEILYWISAMTNRDAYLPRWSPDLMLPRMDLHTRYLPPLQELVERLGRPIPEISNIHILQENYCAFVQGGSAAVTWTGDVSPCIALMHSYQCYVLGREKLIKRYSVGNIAHEKIGDIWNKESYRQFRERVLKFDFSPCVQCGGCYHSETNEEDCLGNTHPVCGDCLWANGVLLCP